jgi:hypothetical protein
MKKLCKNSFPFLFNKCNLASKKKGPNSPLCKPETHGFCHIYKIGSVVGEKNKILRKMATFWWQQASNIV